MQIFTQGPQQRAAKIGHHQPNPEDQEVITATINKLLNGQFSVWSWGTIIVYVLKRSEQRRSETEGTHSSTSEGSVDPRYYQLSELTGYTYFT